MKYTPRFILHIIFSRIFCEKWKLDIYTKVKYIAKSLLTLISEFFLVNSCYIYKNNLLYFIAAVL